MERGEEVAADVVPLLLARHSPGRQPLSALGPPMGSVSCPRSIVCLNGASYLKAVICKF